MTTTHRTFMFGMRGLPAIIEIETLEIAACIVPPRVLGLVIEWTVLHLVELARNWTPLAQEGKFKRIDPLV